jgi:hypothetical protein
MAHLGWALTRTAFSQLAATGGVSTAGGAHPRFRSHYRRAQGAAAVQPDRNGNWLTGVDPMR